MKSVSVLVEFLIYVSVALFTLSVVLYYSHISSSNLQSKASIEDIINTLSNLNNELGNIYTCYNCYTTFQSSLPNPSTLYLYNDSNIISVIYLSSLNCSLIFSNLPQNIIINTSSYGSMYLCNISLLSYQYYLNSQNITENNNICLNLNETNGELIITKC